jgi:hypothetical protein
MPRPRGQAFADLEKLAPTYLPLVDSRANGAAISDEGDSDAMRRTVASFGTAFTASTCHASWYETTRRTSCRMVNHGAIRRKPPGG